MTSSNSTANFLISEIHWADRVSARLRLIMSTCADESGESRQAYIEEEIQRCLEEVPPGKRTLYLDALAEKFPTWQRPAGSEEPIAQVVPKNPETVDEVLQLLARVSPRWSAPDRERLRTRLTELGLIEPVSVDGLGEHLVELKQRLALAPNEPVVPVRLSRLCMQEAECLVKLDQLVWNTWKILAPKSGLKRDTSLGDLRTLVRRYLRGDAEPSDLQMAQQIDRTRQLIAVLLGAMSQVSRGFVKRYQTRYSPDAVRELIKLEGGGGLLTSVDTRCWRKYSDLAAEITEAGIQADMQEIIVKYVEELMRGAPRANP